MVFWECGNIGVIAQRPVKVKGRGLGRVFLLNTAGLPARDQLSTRRIAVLHTAQVTQMHIFKHLYGTINKALKAARIHFIFYYQDKRKLLD